MQDVRRLPERHPQDAVVEGLDQAFVLTDGRRQRRLAETARIAQHRQRRRAVAPGGQQRLPQVVGLPWTRHEPGGDRRRHERHARRDAAAPQMRDELRPLGRDVVAVGLCHPGWKAVEIELMSAGVGDG